MVGRSVVAVLVCALMGVTACGGDGDDNGGAVGASDDSGDDAVDASDSDDGNADGSPDDDGSADECSIGVCGDGLLAALEPFPVPPDVDEFSVGGEYPDRVSQDVFVGSTPDVVADFYRTALPEAGFEITDEFGEAFPDGTSSVMFDVVAPDGRVGNAHVRSAAGSPAQVNLQLFTN